MIKLIIFDYDGVRKENIGALVERSEGEFIIDEPVSIRKYHFRHRDERFDDFELVDDCVDYDRRMEQREY